MKVVKIYSPKEDLAVIKCISEYYINADIQEIIELYNVLKNDFRHGKKMTKQFGVSISYGNKYRRIEINSRGKVTHEDIQDNQKESYYIYFRNWIYYTLAINHKSISYHRTTKNNYNYDYNPISINNESLLRKVKIKKILK